MNQFTDNTNAVGKNRSLFGIIAILLGLLAMLMPGLTGISVIFFIGVIVLAGGITRIIWAFKAGSPGKGVLIFAIGVLTLLCGIALLVNPLLGSGILTILLAVYFVLDGIFEVIAGVQLRPASGWGWMLTGGIVSILLGVIIWRQFPLSGAWAIGILLGIKLFFVGLIMITSGLVVQDKVDNL